MIICGLYCVVRIQRSYGVLSVTKGKETVKIHLLFYIFILNEKYMNV